MLTDQVKTKNQLAYETLKEEIIQGKYPSGNRLVIHKIAKSYGFSEIPVREALKTLEAEGFVRSTPHVGFVVTRPDFGSQGQIFEIRQLLEGQAIGLTAEEKSPEVLAALKNLLEEMEACDGSDSVRLAKLNYQFYDLICASCGNPILYNLIKQVWAMAPRSRFFLFFFCSLKQNSFVYVVFTEIKSVKLEQGSLKIQSFYTKNTVFTPFSILTISVVYWNSLTRDFLRLEKDEK